MKVFISHSSADGELAELVVDLLQRALGLRSREIRCTSVDGYRLPAGARTDEQLRREVADSEVFVGIMSEASLRSAYVTFELGARWGAGKHLVPLLAPGLPASSLEGPLAGINALHLERPAEMHQFVHDIGTVLNREVEPPSVYQALVDSLASFLPSGDTRRDSATRREAAAPGPTVEAGQSVVIVQPTASPKELASFNDFSGAEAAIKQHCLQEWHDDFEMRAHCEQKQRAAVARLSTGKPDGIPSEVFEQIRSFAANEWPTDYEMRLHTEEKQLGAYRELERGAPSDVPDEIFAGIRRRAATEWPVDFEMRLHTEQKQLRSYREVSS